MATTNNVKGCIGILMIEDSMRFPRYSRFAIVRQDSPCTASSRICLSNCAVNLLGPFGPRPVPKLGPAGIDERTAPLEISLKL